MPYIPKDTPAKDGFPIEPLGDRLLVKQVEAADKSPGGIIIPEQAKEAPKEGHVVAVGPGRKLEDGVTIPVQINEGEYVIFANYAGEHVKVDEEEYILLKEEDVLARVRK